MTGNGNWVCFDCREAVRRPTQHKGDVPCPRCGQSCTYAGTQTAIPSKQNIKAWRQLRESIWADQHTQHKPWIHLDNELRFLAKWAQEESEAQCSGEPAHQLQVQHGLPSIEIIKRIRARLDAARIPDGDLAGLYDGQAVEWPWVSETPEQVRRKSTA